VHRPGAGRPFTGAALDRASVERKDPAWVAAAAASPARRGIAAGRDQVLVSGTGPAAALTRLEPTDEQLGEPILLGVADGAPLFAIDLEHEAARGHPADDGSWDRDGEHDEAHLISLREAGLALPHAEGGLAAYATALLGWHRRHRFCANCGHETDSVEAGFERRCPHCGTHHFPRTDPVVIMTVEYDDRLLLGRRAGWPEGRLSVLAGFISPGEAAEEAVVREVREESGIACYDPTYVTSQPWPFPASLMLGFHARSDGGEPTATDGELDEVHWVPRERVRAALDGEDAGFALPGEVSIARFLIERWAGRDDLTLPKHAG
jgi:NAD+ diphosphatase